MEKAKAVMSLYGDATTTVKVGSEFSDQLQVGVHQGSVLSPLLFAIVMDVVSEDARKGLLNEILCADDLVLMSDSMKDLLKGLPNGKNLWNAKG